MPKDILPKVTFCPKTSCPIWQFAHEDILPKDFLPKLTICPKRTNCPRRHFAHNLEGFCPSIFVLLILIYEGFLPIHFTKMGKKKLIYCSDLNLSYICLTRVKKNSYLSILNLIEIKNCAIIVLLHYGFACFKNALEYNHSFFLHEMDVKFKNSFVF